MSHSHVLSANYNYVCMLYYFYQSAGNAARIVEPPQNQTLPVNSVARFTCITIDIVVWEIKPVDSNITTRLSLEIAAVNLLQQGIIVDSGNKSVLLVNATLENNETNVRCLTGENLLNLRVMSNTSTLIVFGE